MILAKTPENKQKIWMNYHKWLKLVSVGHLLKYFEATEQFIFVQFNTLTLF
jgi:hypothetical protein